MGIGSAGVGAIVVTTGGFVIATGAGSGFAGAAATTGAATTGVGDATVVAGVGAASIFFAPRSFIARNSSAFPNTTQATMM